MLKNVEVKLPTPMINNQTVCLNRKLLTDAHIPLLIKYFIQHPQYVKLYAPVNNITSQGIKALLAAVPLQEVDVSDNPIDDEALLAVGQSPSLRSFTANGAAVTDNGIMHLTKSNTLEAIELAARHNLTIEEISFLNAQYPHLRNNYYESRVYLTDAAAQVLTTIPSLRVLDLSHHSITDTGAMTLTTAKLTELHLINTKITDACTSAIAASTTLQKVVLNMNGLTDLGAQNLSSSRSITELVIRQSCIGNLGMRAFAQMPQLQLLNVGQTSETDPLDDTTAECLAQAPKLTKLWIDGRVGITSRGLRALAQSPRLGIVAVSQTIGHKLSEPEYQRWLELKKSYDRDPACLKGQFLPSHFHCYRDLNWIRKEVSDRGFFSTLPEVKEISYEVQDPDYAAAYADLKKKTHANYEAAAAAQAQQLKASSHGAPLFLRKEVGQQEADVKRVLSADEYTAVFYHLKRDKFDAVAKKLENFVRTELVKYNENLQQILSSVKNPDIKFIITLMYSLVANDTSSKSAQTIVAEFGGRNPADVAERFREFLDKLSEKDNNPQQDRNVRRF